jgi:hypothetical protein
MQISASADQPLAEEQRRQDRGDADAAGHTGLDGEHRQLAQRQQ